MRCWSSSRTRPATTYPNDGRCGALRLCSIVALDADDRSLSSSLGWMPMMPVDPIPPELFLAGYPTGIQEVAERLCAVVRRAVPEAIERVRTGWRLIGYDVPLGSRTRYFAFVAPEVQHVHLGFEYGVWMTDPDKLLRGAHLDLRKVRYVTFEPGDPIPDRALIDYVRDAAQLAAMSRKERLDRELDRDHVR